MRFPKIDDVAAELRDINQSELQPEDADEGIDVRLQVYPDGQWAVRWGLSDYDQDHRGFWGASSVPGNNRRFSSKDIARDLIDQAKDQHAMDDGVDEAPQQVRSRRQPSLPGFPDIPEKLDIQIPNMPMWEQIGGDMNPATYGGTIARSDGDALELLKIQPVREYIGEREAAEVGFPFWTREAYFDLDDLNPEHEDVQSALQFIGMSLDELGEDPEGRKAAGERGYTPQQRALIIAEALLDYGRGDEGPAGWSSDIYADDDVKWWGGGVQTIGDALAEEDDEFASEVLLGDLNIDHEAYGPDENEPESGLAVRVSGSNVEITEWTDIEASTGEKQPEGEEVSRRYADVALWTLLDPTGKHRRVYSGDGGESLKDVAQMSEEDREEAIVAAAIAFIAYGADVSEDFVDAIGD